MGTCYEAGAMQGRGYGDDGVVPDIGVPTLQDNLIFQRGYCTSTKIVCFNLYIVLRYLVR